MLKPMTSNNLFLRTNGTWIVDASGQVVFLRGVNFRGYHYQSPAEMEISHTEEDYKNLKSWGFNVVRLLLAWSQVEPAKGVFNEEYFSKYVDRDINWAKKYGIYIVLEMHQNNWNIKWNGNGAPDWAVAQYPATEEGELSAVENFWTNQTLRSSFVNMWKYVASRYVNERVIAGYDLLNEPWWMFDTTKTSPQEEWSVVEKFYLQVIDGIRTVDMNHMIFVEPFLLSPPSTLLSKTPNLVWAPHIYTYVYKFYGKPYSHDNYSIIEYPIESYYRNYVLAFRQPMWIGEFGMDMWVQGSDVWTRDHVQLFQNYGLGWSWWTYEKQESVGPPDMSLLNSDGTPRYYFMQFLMDPKLTL
jgi:endoglycosylceramidase